MTWDIGRRKALAAIGGSLLLGNTARAETPQSGGTLNVGLVNDAKTYDPIYSVEFTERVVLYLVFNTLVKYAPDFCHYLPGYCRQGDVGRGDIVVHYCGCAAGWAKHGNWCCCGR